MATILRKARSAIYARAHADKAAADQAADQNNFVNNSQANDNGLPPPVPPKDTIKNSTSFYPFSSVRNRKGCVDLSTAVESESSIQARERQQSEKQSTSSVARLRHLYRKASTLNLHSRRLRGVSATSASNRRSAHLFPDPDSSDSVASSISTYRSTPSPPETARPVTASTVFSEVAETIVHIQESTTTVRSDSIYSTVTIVSGAHTSPERQVQTNFDVDATSFAQPRNSTPQVSAPDGHYWVEMATTTPPLPYETLKKITVEACETALSNVTAYDHPKTESWNTTIINTILAQLVGETSGTNDSAPKYKFVVNSTIVQHRNSMTEHGGGRRGMHSAAGAYWNNEKDGMWSFKYDAGDSKGLDVVVGIVWVWVG